MLKTIEIRVCNNCNKEIKENVVTLEKGIGSDASTITYNKKQCELDDADFCSLECFLEWIKENLK
jgi:hypothetical protein